MRCSGADCVLPLLHEGDCIVAPPVSIDYRNWKGARRMRRVAPTGQLQKMSNPPWHREEQWLFGAIDCEDGKHKWFALAGIHAWAEDK